jgi:hypothetical protein
MAGEVTCPSCRLAILLPGEEHCPRCGTVLPATPPPGPSACPGCGRPAEPRWRFCPHCNEPLGLPRPPLGPRGRAAVLAAALLTLAAVNTAFLLSLLPWASTKVWRAGVFVLALADLGIGGAFWVYYRSLQSPGPRPG